MYQVYSVFDLTVREVVGMIGGDFGYTCHGHEGTNYVTRP